MVGGVGVSVTGSFFLLFSFFIIIFHRGLLTVQQSLPSSNIQVIMRVNYRPLRSGDGGKRFPLSCF